MGTFLKMEDVARCCQYIYGSVLQKEKTVIAGMAFIFTNLPVFLCQIYECFLLRSLVADWGRVLELFLKQEMTMTFPCYKVIFSENMGAYF